jgi:GNAT superfamily N-acetyltransferase
MKYRYRRMDQERREISFRSATLGRDIPSLVWCANSSTAEGERLGFGNPRERRKYGAVQRLPKIWDSETKSKEIFLDQVELENTDATRGFQGKGIGTQIVNRVEEYTPSKKGRNVVTPWTSRNGGGTPWESFGWWQSRRFQATSEERNEWTKTFGGSEIRMAKKLNHNRSRRDV